MKRINVIEMSEWDALVETTYGRPYSFQQQGGCQNRGTFKFSVPCDADDYENVSVPEEVNAEPMGVKFSAWLARDPKQKLSNPEDEEDYCLSLWWHRNFYPNVLMIANDLHSKGLLEAGEHTILLDW